jgi:antitoxin component YwqK of YwqJK toxin-antitoxin module
MDTAPIPLEPSISPNDGFTPLQSMAPERLDEHDENGCLISRTWLRQGTLHGRMDRFWPNGKPQLSANYDSGHLDGLLYQFDEQGQPLQVTAYVQGRQHGLSRVFVQGRCVSEQNYADGAAHGPGVSFQNDGQPSAKMHFVKGQIEGPTRFFHEGRVVREAVYHAGLLEGEVSDFDRDGGLIQMATYRANVLEGPLRRYWPGGALMEEIVYSQGMPVGPPLRLDIKGRQLDNDQAQHGLLARLEKLVRG